MVPKVSVLQVVWAEAAVPVTVNIRDPTVSPIAVMDKIRMVTSDFKFTYET